MSDTELRARYLEYLACLNDRRWGDLGEFVADRLTYNGNRLRCNDYRSMIERDTDAAPDLRYTPELIVVDGDVLACRLYFRCHPQRTFLGLVPSGGAVSFAEHVFYRFADLKIVEVWSLIDKEAVRAQIGG